jgi:hypothetical protein
MNETTNYSFINWTDETGAVIGTNPQLPITIAGNKILTANYVMAPQLTVEATAGGSTSPAPGTYPETANAAVQVTANPSAGYYFDHWMLDGANVGSTNPYTVTMDKDHTIQAVFAQSTHQVTVTSQPVQGVPVTVDGTGVGNTPITVTVDEGDHTISIPLQISSS